MVSKIESGWIGKFLFEGILFWFSLGTPNDGIIFLAFFPPPLIVVEGEEVPSSNAGNAAMRVLARFINCLISCCLFFLDVLLGVFSVFHRRTDKGPVVVVVHHCLRHHRTGVVFFSGACVLEEASS